MTSSEFDGNAAYSLWWPRLFFVAELSNLCSPTLEPAEHRDWVNRVANLLRRSFQSPTPAHRFETIAWGEWRVHQFQTVNFDDCLQWLRELHAAATSNTLGPKPYFSQRQQGAPSGETLSLRELSSQIRSVIGQLNQGDYFAEALGFDCAAGDCLAHSSPAEELGRLIGKSHLWDNDAGSWSRADLFDFIEVFHDLISLPTNSEFHSYGRDWHPTEYSRPSGQRLYRQLVNQLLGQSNLDLQIAERGKDTGRIVKRTPEDLAPVIETALDGTSTDFPELSFAIAEFRKRGGTIENRRSALFTLAGILEKRRRLLKKELLKNDERALFQIANGFYIRHRDADQKADYGPEFLDWIFYWFVSTINLTDKMLTQQAEPLSQTMADE